MTLTKAQALALLEASGEWRDGTEPDLLVIPSNKEGIRENITLTYGGGILVIVEPNADVVINDPRTAPTAILAGERARVRYLSVLSGVPSAKGAATRFIYLQKDAQLDWMDVMENGSADTSNTAYLAGTGAAAKFRSVFLGTGDERYATAVRMLHAASHTKSNMLTRAALLDESSGHYRGLIRILPDALGCDAYQRQDTLLLGDDARMDATPILEIGNEDVRCSHGVTLGQVDDESLFYLQSRGVSGGEAVELLVQGFFDQMLISMGEEGKALREAIATRIKNSREGSKERVHATALHTD